MRYRKFKIENYKGISKVEIDFVENRILTLVGLNESGKTTILESIRLFFDLISGANIPQEKLNEIRPKGINFTGKIIIEGTLDVEDEDRQKIQQFHDSQGKRRNLDIPSSLTYTFEFEFKTHKYQKTNRTFLFPVKASGVKRTLHDTNKEYSAALLDFIKKQLIPEILFYEDFIFQIPEKIVFQKTMVEGAPPPDAKNYQWQLVLDDILRTVDPAFSSFREYVVSIWDTDNDTASNRISSMEGLLNEKITQGWKELFKDNTSKTNTKLNFKEIRLICTPSGDTIEASFRVKNDSGKEFQINERSKGFKWFFSFLIFTEFRKNRTRNILFLLDEPASNLHSSAQLKILEAIEQLGNGSTVIYSTHSHHLINPLWLNGAYVIINESISEEQLVGQFTQDTGAHKITAEKYYNYVSRSGQSVKAVLFQPILDKLDYAPSQVEPTPEIVITEGKYDWYTYKYFLELLKNKKTSFRLYPGAGANQNWEIIRLYLSWGKSFVVLVDSDNSGEKAKADYIKEFGDFVSDRIFSYDDILGQKDKTTEDLIDDFDKEKLCDAAFGKGSYLKIKDDPKQLKSRLNYAINQLLVGRQKVKVGKNTKRNFDKVAKFVESKLSKIRNKIC